MGWSEGLTAGLVCQSRTSEGAKCASGQRLGVGCCLVSQRGMGKGGGAGSEP